MIPRRASPFAAIAMILGAAACNDVLGISLGEPLASTSASSASGTGGASGGGGAGVDGGEIVWVKPIAGPGTVETSDISTSGGVVAVVGVFEDTVIFDPGAADRGALGPGGGAFVAIYDEAGAFQWARALPRGGVNPSVAVVPDGVVVGGAFHTTASFPDGGAGGGTVLTGGGPQDGYLARFDERGNLLWVRQIGGAQTDGVWVTRPLGAGCLLGGAFEDMATFEGKDGANMVRTSAGLEDAFVALYDADGGLVWVRAIGSTASDQIFGVSGSGLGVYATGVFGAALAPESHPETLEPSGASDVFVLKYDTAGSGTWARRLGSAGASEFVRGIEHVAGDITLRVSGEFGLQCIQAGRSCEITFGDVNRPEGMLTTAGGTDMFLASYEEATGDLIWAKNAGGPGDDYGNVSVVVATTTEGDAIVTGRFVQAATFGAARPGAVTLESAGGADAFIARYDADGVLRWARRAGGAGEEWGRGVAVSVSGAVFAAGTLASDPCVFGPGEEGEKSLSGDTGDAWIARYSP